MWDRDLGRRRWALGWPFAGTAEKSETEDEDKKVVRETR